MAKFLIEAVRTTTFSDVVEADSLEHAEALVKEWIDDDHTITDNRWDLTYSSMSDEMIAEEVQNGG